jgi:hypothetical protein
MPRFISGHREVACCQQAGRDSQHAERPASDRRDATKVQRADEQHDPDSEEQIGSSLRLERTLRSFWIEPVDLPQSKTPSNGQDDVPAAETCSD